MSVKPCRISRKQQLRLAELFVAESTARTAADLVGLHRNSAALFYRKLRELIACKIAEADPEFGAFEVDESYFGGVRKGKRGRGAAGKVLVFGILKRGAGSLGHLLDALPFLAFSSLFASTRRKSRSTWSFFW